MGLRQLITAFGAKLKGLARARRIKTRVFSGTPVLLRIEALEDHPVTWALTFKNGLMLTLGEAGVLDYQDREFGNFMGGSGLGTRPGNQEFLIHLHKIVLKSLLRYIIHPGIDAGQREGAAEAATKLWLASEPGPGRTATHAGSGIWASGSAHESASSR